MDATARAGRIDTTDPVDGRLELPLIAFRADDVFDSELERRLDVQRYPLVVARLLEAVAHGDDGRYHMSGDLTFHGRTVRVDGSALVRCDESVLVLEGSVALDIRRFGIDPPRLLLLRVHPQVQVTLRLQADAHS